MARVEIEMGDAGVVVGTVAPGYEPVCDAFVANFTEHGDLGAGLCIYRHGHPVVELDGGWARRSEQVPYGPDTLQLVFSTTKGATALCAHVLAQRGLLDLQAPVADYWPEFAQAGKEHLPVYQLLTHEAGLPTVDTTLTLEQALAWDPVVEALAAQQPLWEPGTAHGYHALTFGWLVGEVVRRVDGRSLGRFFAEEVAEPLGLEFWIGLPERYEERVAPLRMARLAPSASGQPDPATALDPKTLEAFAAMVQPGALALRALSLNGAFGTFAEGGGPFNRRDVHAAEIPAANGITNARSLARLYAALVGTVDGVRVLSPAQMERARSPQVDGPDRVLVVRSRFGLGFMLHGESAALLGPGSFGHPGAGGSVGFADPDAGVAFGYVMNQMRFGLAGDDRSARLIDALRRCLRHEGP